MSNNLITSTPVVPELDPIWRAELDLLIHFLQVCQKYNLKTWACGGTLLGAVRHKGFIPWDDDIDMDMMREDYEKLLEIAPKEFKYPYFLQTAYTDKDYCRGHAQLRNCETAAILPVETRQPFNQGVFIDIFVFDASPEREVTALRDSISEIMRKMMYWKYYWYTAKNPLVRFCAFLYHGMAQVVPHRPFYRKWESLFKKYSIFDYEYIDKPSFAKPGTFRHRYPKSDFSDTVWLDFESIKIPAPVCYEHVLSEFFGKDYMTPKRIPTTHGGGVIFDAKRSYKEVLAELKQNKK